MFVYPYKMGSNSAKVIGKTLGAKLIRLENSKFSGSATKVVINWGNSTPNEEVEKCIVLNSPKKVSAATNKLTFFQKVKEFARIPDFTTDKATAEEWSNGGNEVVVREKLTGHSGEGIVMLADPIEFEQYNHNRAKLYVKYVKKKEEYRIHIMNGEVILIQRKAKRSDVHPEMVNWKIRNKANGFIFAKNEGTTPPQDVIDQAMNAIKAVELDFGAIDVVWNDYKKEAYVLEINSAPGLEGTTGDTYIEALKAYVAMLGDQETQAFNNSSMYRRKKKSLSDILAQDPEPFPALNVTFDEVAEIGPDELD